jgi:hypothetical protein
MPMVVDCARLSIGRGCVWRRCVRCEDLVALPDRIRSCNAGATLACRRGWSS